MIPLDNTNIMCILLVLLNSMKNVNWKTFLNIFLVVLALNIFNSNFAYAIVNVSTSVDSISVINKFAVDDGTYNNGFKWYVDVTIPSSENIVTLKFDNLKTTNSFISSSNNLRYYSSESLNNNNEESSIVISKINEYGGEMVIDTEKDLDLSKSGRQIRIIVEAAVPKGSIPGKYSMSYGFKSFDRIKPRIELIGSDTVTVERYSEYKDEGALVYDNQDAPITPIIDTSSLDLNNVGEYQIKYSAKDKYDNIANDIYRTVRVVDTTGPIITISDYNKNVTNQDVEVFASTSEGFLNNESYIFNQNGEYAFSASDDYGNVSSVTVTITNIDKEPPVIDIIGCGDENDPDFYECSHERGELYVDEGAVATDNYSSYVPVGTDASNFNGFEKGVYSIRYYAVDEAGNQAEEAYRIIFVDDTTPPIMTFDLYETGMTNKDITVVAHVNEGDVSMIEHTFTENGSYVFDADDGYGNRTSKEIIIDNIDKEAPIISLNGSDVITHERTEDFIDPGVTVTDNHDTDIKYDVDFGGFNKDIVGTYILTYSAKDEAGNVSNILTRTVEVKDTKDPVITLSDYPKDFVNAPVVVKASVNEGKLNFSQHTFNDNGSFTFKADDNYGNHSELRVEVKNIDKILPQITLNGGSSITYERGIPYVDPGAVVTDNNSGSTYTQNPETIYTSVVGTKYTILYTAKDVAGNIATTSREVTIVDTTPPVISFNDYIKTPTKGDIEVIASVNEGTLTESSYTFTDNGSHTFVAEDIYGNKSSSTINISNIDRIKPVIYLKGDVIINIYLNSLFEDPGVDISDNLSSNISPEVSSNVDVKTIGQYLIKYNAKDEAGNIANEITRTINVVEMTN